MARSRVSLRGALFFSALLTVSMFSAGTLAADSATKATTPAAQKTANAKSAPAPAESKPAAKTTQAKPAPAKSTAAMPVISTPAAAKSSAAPAPPASSQQAPPKESDSPSAAPPPKASETASKQKTVAITATGGQQPSDTGAIPTLTSSVAPPKLDLPTLPPNAGGVPNYPAPSVPPTQNAPFMQHSNLPDGTVFIAVGAILGGFGAALLIWRAIVAYLLHRSIARAALAQHVANDKAAFAPPAAPFYMYSDRDSSLNLGGSGVGGSSAALSARGVRRTNRGPTPSATPSQTNLFFSPTAPGASNLGASSNRDSRLLPSGFYAAGSALPAGAGQSINMSNLRPDSRHGRNIGPSPPDSPNFGPMRTNLASRNMSGSSVNLAGPISGRAPSAFLDDLLDEQPSLFPPGTGPSHNRTYSHSSHGGGRY
ncbi:hypothetical protein SEPCBS119000_002326 [Sporothrix epigloea]|uniref:Csi2 protein n=1 Tax=Sporothrix epigloea TaxID=1892477 RepID=A0ABP0DHA1_9PEZI